MAMKPFILIFLSVYVLLSAVTEGATVDPQVADDRKDSDPVRKRRAYHRGEKQKKNKALRRSDGTAPEGIVRSNY